MRKNCLILPFIEGNRLHSNKHPIKEESEKSLLIPQSEIQLDGKCTITKVLQLKKTLGSFDVFMFVVGIIVGSGIYVSPA